VVKRAKGEDRKLIGISDLNILRILQFMKLSLTVVILMSS
jgi:hypothetical protein